MACSNKSNNPFYNEWDTPFGVPPFDQIEENHYMPALLEGIDREKLEILDIIENSDEPSFENTIETFESTGEFLIKFKMFLII